MLAVARMRRMPSRGRRPREIWETSRKTFVSGMLKMLYKGGLGIGVMEGKGRATHVDGGGLQALSVLLVVEFRGNWREREKRRARRTRH